MLSFAGFIPWSPETLHRYHWSQDPVCVWGKHLWQSMCYIFIKYKCELEFWRYWSENIHYVGFKHTSNQVLLKQRVKCLPLKKASQIHKHLYEVRERTSCHTAAAPCTPSQSAVMTYTSYGNHEPLITYSSLYGAKCAIQFFFLLKNLTIAIVKYHI